MPGLLIIAHAPLASSLKAVAEHAYPDCAVQLAAFDVLPDVPIEEVEAQARQLLERQAAQELLIFTDVFGATPCNIAQRLLCRRVARRGRRAGDRRRHAGRHAGGDVAAPEPDAQARP